MKNFFRKIGISKTSSTNKVVRVTFNRKVKVLHLQPHEEEVPADDLWYSQHQSEEIRAANQRVMKMMKIKTLKDRMEKLLLQDDIRGLENFDAEGRERSWENRRESVAVVLSTQSLLQATQTVDTHALSKSYSRTCRDATKFARDMALRDEQFVLNHIRSKEDIWDASQSSCCDDDQTETTVAADDDSIFEEGDDSCPCLFEATI